MFFRKSPTGALQEFIIRVQWEFVDVPAEGASTPGILTTSPQYFGKAVEAGDVVLSVMPWPGGPAGGTPPLTLAFTAWVSQISPPTWGINLNAANNLPNPLTGPLCDFLLRIARPHGALP